jgi:hypothetical protein
MGANMDKKASPYRELLELKEKLRKERNERRERKSPASTQPKEDQLDLEQTLDSVIEALVRPDICIHKRGLTDKKDNLLVIELKKADSNVSNKLDIAKSKAYTADGQTFQYQYAVFLKLGKSGSVSEAKLFRHDKNEQEEFEIKSLVLST